MSDTTYEVEQKFPIADAAKFTATLAKMGLALGPPREQVDSYFNHPSRDFATTDEALRLRRVDGDNCVTYKGPQLDAAVKTRREIEVPFAAGSDEFEKLKALLTALGFRHVADVRKRRRECQLHEPDSSITITFDDVDHVGSYCEIEILSSPEKLAAAQARLRQLADTLGLSQPERCSYLSLLLGTSKQ